MAHSEVDFEIEGGNAFSRRFVSPLFMGSSLVPINGSIIATALVQIAAAVNVSVGRTAVLVSALYMASAIAQPTAGKLSEFFGPRRVFLAGIITVFAGGLVGGFGQDLIMLIISRVLIGIGTSSAYPSAMLLIRRRAQNVGMKEPPGSVLGGLVIAAMVTTAIGLPIGGILVDSLGWRSTFFINVPLALLALFMTLFWIPPDPGSSRKRTPSDIANGIDVIGILSFATMMSGVVVFLLSLPGENWLSLGISVIFGLLLVLWEMRAKRPFLDVKLLSRNYALTRTYVRYALATLCIYTVLYGLTQWIEADRNISAFGAGLLILPMSVLSAVLARWISKRNLIRLPLVVSPISSVVGSVGILLLTGVTPIPWIAVITLTFGFTLGGASTGNQTTLYTEAIGDQIAIASGLLRTFGFIGSIASSALIAIVFNYSVTDTGLHFIGMIMLILSILGVMIVLTDRKVMKTPKVT